MIILFSLRILFIFLAIQFLSVLLPHNYILQNIMKHTLKPILARIQRTLQNNNKEKCQHASAVGFPQV